MPIYEYRCNACKRRTSVFVRSVSSPVRAACEHCGGKKLSRLVSKFAVHDGRLNFDDPSSMGSLDENDPQAMARFMRQMGEEAGEDMGPEFDEMIGRMERGEDPESAMGDSAVDDLGGGDEF